MSSLSSCSISVFLSTGGTKIFLGAWFVWLGLCLLICSSSISSFCFAVILYLSACLHAWIEFSAVSVSVLKYGLSLTFSKTFRSKLIRPECGINLVSSSVYFAVSVFFLLNYREMHFQICRCRPSTSKNCVRSHVDMHDISSVLHGRPHHLRHFRILPKHQKLNNNNINIQWKLAMLDSNSQPPPCHPTIIT